MGFIILSIPLFIIGVAGTIYAIWYFREYGLSCRDRSAFAIGGLILIAISLVAFRGGLSLTTYPLEGSYKLIENSDGDYMLINSENEYEVTIINNGIKQNKTFTNPNIIYIENENDARIEINKGNWSIEETLYIPYIPKP